MSKMTFLKRGFSKKCPFCGKSPIFTKYIKTHKKCSNCGIKLSNYKSDDAPAYITIFLVGHVLIPIILLTEKHFNPSITLQMIAWPIVTFFFTIWLLPRVKGAFIGVQIFLGDKSGKS